MEEGIAHLYFISNNQTTLHGKITQSIPKKRAGSSQHDKSKISFFSKILNQLVKEINFENIKITDNRLVVLIYISLNMLIIKLYIQFVYLESF